MQNPEPPAPEVGTPTPEETGVGGSPAPDPENSQTGSPGAVECYEPTDCFDLSQAELGPLGRVELLAATCTHLSSSANGLPLCECRMRLTPVPGRASVPEPYQLEVHPGLRPGACSDWSRAPGCLYCEHEFPGCSIDQPESCDAVCADMTTRLDLDMQRTLDVTLRLNRCTVDYRCQVVSKIDGKCYAGTPNGIEPAELDCALPDDELVQHLDDPSQPSCATPPPVACTSASDCPAGLACNSGICGPCSTACSSTFGPPTENVCEGDVACADGELCALGLCVPSANVGCRFGWRCPEGEVCSLSGISKTGRGNADTRSFCQPY